MIRHKLHLFVDDWDYAIEERTDAHSDGFPFRFTTGFGSEIISESELDELIDMLTQFRDLYRAEQAKGESSENPIWQQIIEGSDDAP